MTDETPKNAFTKEYIDSITRKLADSGRIVEGGWMGFMMEVIPLGAPQIQLDEMRIAFYAGASYLLGAIMGMLDPEAEPTDNDMRRLDNIAAELSAYCEAMQQKAAARLEKADC